MKMFILRFVCSTLERLCCLTHPFGGIIYKLTGGYCHLCSASIWLNDKYNLGVWKSVDSENP